MEWFEAAATCAYICFRSAGGKLIIVKRLWACYMEKALYTGVYAGGGGVHWVHVHPPPPHLGKSSPQKCPKEERKFRPDMSAKKNVHILLRCDKIKTKKVGKNKKDSKKKRIKNKEIKKEDSRLSEIESILHFWTTIQAQRNRSERFKIISVYINKAISSDRRYLWQIATAAFNHTHLG